MLDAGLRRPGRSWSRRRPARRSASLQAEALGDSSVDLLDAHAEPAAAGLAEVARAGRRRACAMFGGIAKPMPIEPPEGEIDRRVDADHLAVHVEQRAAGIAAVDRGVGLDEVVVGPGIDVAVARRDDAGVTEPPRPNGLPIAITQSPTRTCRSRRTSPPCSGLSASTCSTARSVLVVAADQLGLERRCRRRRSTVISSAPRSRGCW